MKVLIISTLYPPHVEGGAEKAAAQLAEGLVHRGHQVVVATLHPESKEVVEDLNGVRVYRFPIDNYYWPFGRKKKPNAFLRLAWHLREMWNGVAARRIGEVLDNEKPDVVNTHNVCGFSLATWREVKLRGLTLIHTVHDYYLMCSRCTLFRNGKNCENRCVGCRILTINRRRLTRLPDAVVSVSRHALSEHVRRSYFAGRPATVIYNIQSTLVSASAKKEPSENLTFGFIGRIQQEKGIETLLAATRRLVTANWKLKIAGSGVDAYVDQLMSLYPDKRIEWLGFTEAAMFYSSVDIVIIPSLWAEPLPYVCVESLHAGKAMICASSGGIPEIARLSDTVEFFLAGDANALAEKMNRALAWPKTYQSQVPAPSKISEFQETHVVEGYLREYQRNDGISPCYEMGPGGENRRDTRSVSSKDQTSASVTQNIGSRKD